MYLERKRKEIRGKDGCHCGGYNKKLKGIPAYFTLEASLVVPMVLCIIVMLIHLSYYMYQKAILAQDTYLLGYRATVLGRQMEADGASYVQGTASTQFGNRYIGSPEPQVSVDDNDRLVKLHAQSEPDHAAMSWHELMPGDGWEATANAKADVIHRGAHIRRIDRVIDLGKIAFNHVNK